MPSSTLPTGTVSRQSRGARTFPLDAETPSIEREDAESRGARVGSRETGAEPQRDRSGGSAASAGAPRFGEPVARSRATARSTPSAGDRIAELERENVELKREVGALRDRLRRKQEDLQDVVDRYERLLAEAKRSTGSNRPNSQSSLRSRSSSRSRSGLGVSNSPGLLDRLSGAFGR